MKKVKNTEIKPTVYNYILFAIQSMCQLKVPCEECPMYDDLDGKCVIMDIYPDAWDIPDIIKRSKRIHNQKRHKKEQYHYHI